MPKFNSIDNIPARVFFQILETNNFQLLKPKPSEKGLEEVFTSIYDQYFDKMDDPQSKIYMDVKGQFLHKRSLIDMLKKAIYFYTFTQTTLSMREAFKETLMDVYNIDLDLEKPFVEEMHRISTIEIGLMENDLVFLEQQLKELDIKGDVKHDFYDVIADLSTVLENNSLLNENITLATFVSLKKVAKQKIEYLKKNKK